MKKGPTKIRVYRNSQLTVTQSVPKSIPPNPTKSQLKIKTIPAASVSLCLSGKRSSFPSFPSVKSQFGIRVSSRGSRLSRLKLSSSVPSVPLWQKPSFPSFQFPKSRPRGAGWLPRRAFASATKSTSVVLCRARSWSRDLGPSALDVQSSAFDVLPPIRAHSCPFVVDCGLAPSAAQRQN